MNGTWEKEAARLREELAGLLATLKHNREKVPLDVLKTKDKKGYDTLCAGISCCASDYAKLTVLHGIRIHKSCLEEAVPIINGTIAESGILKQLAEAAFRHQDMEEFDSHANALRGKILAGLEPFYMGHLGLYITQECLEDPDVAPLLYCAANHCIWQDGKWLPLELYEAAPACLQGKSA